MHPWHRVLVAGLEMADVEKDATVDATAANNQLRGLFRGAKEVRRRWPV